MKLGFGNNVYSSVKGIAKLGFLPSDLDGLKLWLDANRGVYSRTAAKFVASNNEYLDISVGSGPSLGTAYTIAGWVYKNGTDSTIAVYRSSNDSTPVLFQLDIKTDKGRMVVRDDNDTLVQPQDSTSLSTGWHFMAGVRDGDTVKVSVNGGSFTTASGSLGTISENHLTLGALDSGGDIGSYLDGRIDETGLWNRALSLTEVQELYNSGNGVSYGDLTDSQKNNLVSWWGLNETSGTRKDSHGSNDLSDKNGVSFGAGKVKAIAGDGHPVKLWEDRSSNGSDATQATTSKKAEYKTNDINSRSSVHADGTDDYMTISQKLSQGNDFTVFAVFQMEQAVDTVVRLIGQDPFNSNGFFCIDGNDDGTFRFVYKDSGGNSNSSGNTAAVSSGSPYIIVGYVRNGKVGIRLNGSAETETSHNGLTSNNVNMSMFAEEDGNNPANIKMLETGGYNTGLSDADIQLIEEYAASKYGITLS